MQENDNINKKKTRVKKLQEENEEYNYKKNREWTSRTWVRNSLIAVLLVVIASIFIPGLGGPIVAQYLLSNIFSFAFGSVAGFATVATGAISAYAISKSFIENSNRKYNENIRKNNNEIKELNNQIESEKKDPRDKQRGQEGVSNHSSELIKLHETMKSMILEFERFKKENGAQRQPSAKTQPSVTTPPSAETPSSAPQTSSSAPKTPSSAPQASPSTPKTSSSAPKTPSSAPQASPSTPQASPSAEAPADLNSLSNVATGLGGHTSTPKPKLGNQGRPQQNNFRQS